ncbi:hypothetical protein A3H65_03185 [Candidatus Giovannonibacteria bacterium RIFCSPLOWO2_02_FULL_45_14]|uniref:Uncharacterized protein n=1 Tax=Candidatus Giovannonibacteria bacterium RIFCSPLOWO2_12_FULL_44_15 TaxID=1798364 RepID=A0A1F5Y1C3_9BACT|nr:MAG: hypothetical protein A3C75_00365 [Candidatus Giovannonibacteria bacterium RIFCSPHIGHO2_02_FULL_44_31]OGF77023.1 MAG: hypothetical protein A3E62_04135 [Candidatus Giovannonibacteria bacterium RIFCSPHIGHO2_12_FULL_44_29]OGF90801.1 MAG: hypothetical protein A3H65_03185 [Candidatus Giovannonibacteria bacterium RIFCSPLOWO2_02_FULL_45_14]OGF93856.1 MAG: hypothetical protein A3G54_03800 [Candidatus Giovannonibacteria bacterium RIFCSPLOWO2_12_FULL_44_15]
MTITALGEDKKGASEDAYHPISGDGQNEESELKINVDQMDFGFPRSLSPELKKARGRVIRLLKKLRNKQRQVIEIRGRLKLAESRVSRIEENHRRQIEDLNNVIEKQRDLLYGKKVASGE